MHNTKHHFQSGRP